MTLGLVNTLQSKSARWLRLLVVLAAFVSVSGQALESGHIHFDSQPVDCWVFHSSSAAVDASPGSITHPHLVDVFCAGDYQFVLARQVHSTPPATGPPHNSK